MAKVSMDLWDKTVEAFLTAPDAAVLAAFSNPAATLAAAEAGLKMAKQAAKAANVEVPEIATFEAKIALGKATFASYLAATKVQEVATAMAAETAAKVKSADAAKLKELAKGMKCKGMADKVKYDATL